MPLATRRLKRLNKEQRKKNLGMDTTIFFLITELLPIKVSVSFDSYIMKRV